MSWLGSAPRQACSSVGVGGSGCWQWAAAQLLGIASQRGHVERGNTPRLEPGEGEDAMGKGKPSPAVMVSITRCGELGQKDGKQQSVWQGVFCP